MDKFDRAWQLMRLDTALETNEQSTMTTTMAKLLSGDQMEENLSLVTRMLVDNQSISGCNLAKTLINAYQKECVDHYRKVFNEHKAGIKNTDEADVAKARLAIVKSGELRERFDKELVQFSTDAADKAKKEMQKAQQQEPAIKVSPVDLRQQKQQTANIRVLDIAASLKK